MYALRVRPYLLAMAVKKPLQLPVMPLHVTVPAGAKFRLDYIMFAFPVTVVARVQSSPQLFYQLYDSRGLALNKNPIPIGLESSPGGVSKGGASVKALVKWGIEYEPLATISILITGQTAGPVPATVSVTLVGMRDKSGGV